MNSKSTFSRTIIIGIILTGLSSVAEPEGKNIAYKTAKQKGVIEPAEVLKLETQKKDIPKDWMKLDNNYFSVSYPECFKFEALGDVDDPKMAAEVILKRESSCLQYKENWNESNWLSIQYTLSPAKTIGLKSSFLGVSPVFRQKAEVNKLESFVVAGLMDHFDEKTKSYVYDIRWQIIIKCKNKVFLGIFWTPPGQASVDRVNANDYSIPDDFKEIISTFQCKK